MIRATASMLTAPRSYPIIQKKETALLLQRVCVPSRMYREQLSTILCRFSVTYNNGESASIDQGTRDVSSVLTSSEKAYACGFDSNETVDTGTFNLMTLSTEQRYIDNEANYNYVLACGTTDFVSDKYIGSSTYGNVDILYSAMKTMGKITVPNGIEFKIFDNNELNISTSEAYAWTVILSALLPVVTIVTGIVVYIRRRRL